MQRKAPTIEQVLKLFAVCHICNKNVHSVNQDSCDSCHEKTCEDAYNSCFDSYGGD